MKQFLLFLLITFTPVLLFAQVELSTDFDVNLGEPYKVVDASSKRYFPIGDNHTISVKTSGETVFIQKFKLDGPAKEVSRQEYKKELPRGSKLLDIIPGDNKLFYIYYTADKKNKNYKVYLREISHKGTLGSQRSLFTTQKMVTRIPFNMADIIKVKSAYDWGLNPHFEAITSFDKSKVLIRYRNVPKSKKDAENYDVLGFQVFDKDMKKMWGKELKMPYTEKDMNNLCFGVLSSGDAFMIAQKNTNKTLELFNINSDGLTKNKLDISGDYHYMKINLQEDAEGNLICAGLYSETAIDLKFSFGGASLSYNTNGVIYFKTNTDGEILSSKDYEFPLKLIQQYVSDRIKKRAEKREGKGKAGIEDLKLVNMITQEDGSTVFICERQYVRSEMWGTQTKSVYHFYNIVVMKINADGELEWIKKIPKNQAGVNGRGQMSIKYIQGNGYHYVLYVDNPKNLNISLDQNPATHKDGMGGFLTACKIDDATGKYEKHTVLDMRDIEGKVAHQFAVTRIYEVNAAEQIFSMEAYLKGKKDGMIRIKLKK